MKINAINSTNYMTKGVNFKNTAVPYPEYETGYYYVQQPSSITRVVDKISTLFTPEITQKSQTIKNGINQIYETKKTSPDYYNNNSNKHLLSLMA